MWEWCNFCTCRVNEVELRENIEIASPGALKMEAFQAHLGVQTVKNEGQEGIEKTMPKRKPLGSGKDRKASRFSPAPRGSRPPGEGVGGGVNPSKREGRQLSEAKPPKPKGWWDYSNIVLY